MARPWVSIRAPALTPRCRQQTRQAVVCSASDDRPSMFIFGLGYTGIAVANYLRHRGWNVVGTARNEEKRDALQAKGFQVFDFAPDEYELLGGKALECLEAATHVLSTVPPNEEEAIEDPVLMAHMRNLGDKASRFKWIGYISSTSVYGNHDGDWVNEQSEVRATSGKGFIRLMAEHEWLHLYYNYHAPVHIFRCGGIYGPRRSAIEAVRQAGLPSPSQRRRAQQQYTFRVHVYDICQTIEASTRHPNPGSVYNIADDDPAGRLEVMQYAAQLLEQAHEPIAGLAEDSLGSSSSDEQPPEVTSSRGAGNGGAAPGSSDVIEVLRGSEGGALALTRVAAPARAGEKRVSNQRIKRELGVRLAFPTYREGLAAILRNDMRPFD